MKDPVTPSRLIEAQDYRWYACFTRPRAEKAVEGRLLEADVECYLPLQRVRRRWSDRLKWVREPLIRSYIFVRVNAENYRKAQYTEGILKFITFGGQAVAIPDEQIDAIRMLLRQEVDVEVTIENFEPGQAVEVSTGPLIGLRGELVETRGSKKVLVRLGQIGQGLLVSIDPRLLSRV